MHALCSSSNIFPNISASDAAPIEIRSKVTSVRQQPLSKTAEIPGDAVMTKALGNVARDAAVVFTVRQLQGSNFSLSHDRTPVAIFDNHWTSAGQNSA